MGPGDPPARRQQAVAQQRRGVPASQFPVERPVAALYLRRRCPRPIASRPPSISSADPGSGTTTGPNDELKWRLPVADAPFATRTDSSVSHSTRIVLPKPTGTENAAGITPPAFEALIAKIVVPVVSLNTRYERLQFAAPAPAESSVMSKSRAAAGPSAV